MLSLPEIESLVMQETVADTQTSMLLFGMVDKLRQAERTLHERETRIKMLEEALEDSAIDGISSPRGLVKTLQRTLADAAQHGDTGLFVVVEVENLEQLHNAYGEDGANAALNYVAQELHAILRTTDILAQRDTTSFAMLMTRCDPESAILRVFDALRGLNSMRVGFATNNTALQVGFGTAAYYAGGTAESLMQQAESALRQQQHQQRLTHTPRVYLPRVQVQTVAPLNQEIEYCEKNLHYIAA